MKQGRGRAGAVASPHFAASAVGHDVLEAGGTAMDAAVATNAMLGVVYPHMCGVGGDAFLLYHEAATGTVHCLNGSGPSPALATQATYRRRGLDGVPARGPLAVTVPGVVRAWETALDRFGSLTLAELLDPAIVAAANGVDVTARLAGWIAAHREDVRGDRSLAASLLDEAGEPLPAGATMRFPELASTLDRLARAGASDFYTGALGAEIAAAVEAGGGLLRQSDLAGYRAEWVEPLRIEHGGVEVLTTPPNSQGIVTLLMLGDLAADERATGTAAERVRALVSAKRAAFAVRDAFVADPECMPFSGEALLRRGTGDTVPAVAPPISGDTVYVGTVDRHGNACSLIQSIYYAFGAAFVAGDTGVLLHNRAHYFSLGDDGVNCLRPGMRPLHTLMACMAREGGRLRHVFGTMGADGQPQTNVQVLQHLLDGAHPDAAVSAPRVLHGRFVLEDDPDVLHVESTYDPYALATLEETEPLLHVVPAGDERFGHAHAITIGDDGRLSVGVDPRSDGRG